MLTVLFDIANRTARNFCSSVTITNDIYFASTNWKILLGIDYEVTFLKC